MRSWRHEKQFDGAYPMLTLPELELKEEKRFVDFQEQRAALEDIFDRSSITVFSIEDVKCQQVLPLVASIDTLISEYRGLFEDRSEGDISELSVKVSYIWETITKAIEAIEPLSDILHPSYLSLLDELYPLASTSYLMSKGYSLITSCFKKKAFHSKEIVSRYKKYAEGIEYLSEYVQECMQYPDLNKSSSLYRDVTPFSNYLLEFVNSPSSISENFISNSSAKAIESYSLRIRNASKAISYDIYRANNFLVDYVGDEVVYVDPQSAEGKALQRIRQSFDEVKWIVDDEDPGTIEQVMFELEKRGYREKP